MNLQVNPVHVLDIGIALPGLILAAVLLMRKRRMGYILASTGLVFIIVVAIALAAMVILTHIRGIGEDPSVALIFAAMSLLSGLFLFSMLRNLRDSSG